MPRWLPRVLSHIHRLAAEGKEPGNDDQDQGEGEDA